MDFKEIKELSKECSVLIVEDDKVVRESLKRLFSLFFHSIEEAENGKEGLNKYIEKNYDLVITDITMPVMGGFEMIEELKKIKAQQKIIVLSAHNDSENLQKMIELNIDGFVAKPIHKEQLFQELQKVLERIRAEKLIKSYRQILEDEVKRTKEELKRNFFINNLTSLPNREALKEKLNEWSGGILLVDIKNFSSINLVYGDEGGNYVLKEFGKFLQKFAPIYHIDGDIFALLVNNIEAERIAQDIMHEVKKFVVFYENNEIEVTLTIAVSTVRPLLKTAFVELKELKKQKFSLGKYTQDLPTEKMHIKIQRYLPLLNMALKRDWIVPYFQPIVDNVTKKVTKYEALVRIVDDKGVVHPAYEFIEVAKLSGLIDEITAVVIEKVFQRVTKDIKVSINLDEHDLQNQNFLNFIDKVAKKNRINPSCVTFEILENIQTANLQVVAQNIEEIKKMGFSIAIDDFGAQCSNFERIHEIDADIIKIDGKFIKDIVYNEKSLNVVKAICAFAKSMNAKIIAEFVSDEEIYKIVRELEIDCSQGFYFSYPRKDFYKPVVND